MPSNFPHFSNNGCELGDLLDYKPEMKSWCYRVLPLTYDDSLSYYEVLCKNIAMISKALSKDMPEMMNTINCMQNFIQAMSSHLNEFIDNYNSNINRIDGELSRIETKFDNEVIRLDNKIDTETADIRANYVKRAGDTMTGQLDMTSNKIVNVGIPTADGDSANKKYVDDNDEILDNKIDTETADIRANYVKRAGDTMSGQLNMNKADTRWFGDNNKYVHISSEFNNAPLIKLSGETPTTTNGVLNITPTNISFLETKPGQLSGLDTPTGDTYAANKKYVDDKVAALGTVLEYKGTKPNIAALPSTGNKAGDVWYVESERSAYAWVIDTANPQGHWEEFGPPINLEPYLKKDGSVPMTGNLDMGGHSVTNTAAPTNNTDVANKGYVDTKVGDINRFVLKTGDTMTGALDMSGNKITNVAAPTADNDSANKKYVDENGFQGIPVTRDEAYISTPTNVLSTKVLADPTAPSERPINKDQIAVYSETNQTYAENDVTGTLLVADPHSAMEAVNKRTLDGYLSKANINDELERVTSVKGVNPGTENYRIVSTNTETMGEGRIPAMTALQNINVSGIELNNNGELSKISLNPDNISLLLGQSAMDNGISIELIKNQYDNNVALKINLYKSGTIHKIIETSQNKTSFGNGKINLYYKNAANSTAIEIKADGSTLALRPYGISFSIPGQILNLKDPQDDNAAATKHYVDTNTIKVEGTPQEGSTIAYINGKWTVVDHTSWTPFNQ